MAGLAKLHTQDLVKEYDNRRVVDSVSIEVNEGEIVGLLGPNGAGKTTTFNMIVGIIRPNGGEVFLDETSLSGMAIHDRARHGIGYLAQDKSIFRKLTVDENIRAITQVMPGWSKQQQNEKVESLLQELGLEKLADQPAYTLSGGERRRVEIARALVPEPKFIMLDEPFSGVDPIVVEELQGIIRQMKTSGLGVLITDHNVRETLTVTDRAYIIHEGTVMVSGTATFLVNDAKARELYLGENFYMREDS
ncbi:LPS export ABC transporter ATP-binding protein [Candidatus Sumerlaeota bacterium]